MICYFSHACTRYTVLASKGTDTRLSIAASVYHMGPKQVQNQVRVLRGKKLKNKKPTHQNQPSKTPNPNQHAEISVYGNNISSLILLDML